ncbi:MAG: serine hydrolase [Pseudomonadota bacterium]
MRFSLICATTLALLVCIWGPVAQAAQYAAYVMDARTGKVLHARNANTPLHPASLTKMMTLYVVFEEIRQGRMDLDDMVKVTREAAAKPPSKLGLKVGQRISLRHLIRASAVKSANDAAAALAVHVSGSEAAFARKMTRMARAMGLSRTTFKNASGLTQSGHLSTARDMAVLGRRLFYDFPEYYNLFSRLSTDAGVRTVSNTNRRLLSNYAGADGIKTGFTNAAGYNLVSSARRGNQRVIVSMFGGRSTASRNKRVAELMDMGFARMPKYARVNRPLRVNFDRTVVAASKPVTRSARPEARPQVNPIKLAQIARAQTDMADEVRSAVEAVIAGTATAPQTPNTLTAEGSQNADTIRVARPVARPQRMAVLTPDGTLDRVPVQTPSTAGVGALGATPQSAKTPSSAWGVDLGRHATRHAAESKLLRTALQELETLDQGKRRVDAIVVEGRTLYRARFTGLTQANANRACARLVARSTECGVLAPKS